MLKYVFCLGCLLWSSYGFAAQGDIISIAGGAYPVPAQGKLANNTAIGSSEGIAIDAVGNVYFADFTYHQIKKINRQTGAISVIAGTGVAGYSGDGGLAVQATLNQPVGLAFSSTGELYVSDYRNHAIRKINLGTGIISPVAGTGIGGLSGDGGQAVLANIYLPQGLAFDTNSNLYFADSWNNRVRKINGAGIISTVAGTTFGFSGDGYSATLAKLYGPTDVTVDVNNNVYIADYYNNRVRKVDVAGTISTFAGNGAYAFAGDGGLAVTASLKGLSSVTFDVYGDMLISDSLNQRIRKVNGSGIITTIAGDGFLGFFGDGGQSQLARFRTPGFLAVDSFNNIYVSDSGNKRIRMIGNVLSHSGGANISFPVVDDYGAQQHFGLLSLTNANGGVANHVNYALPLPILDGSFVANVAYDVPVFASDSYSGGLSASHIAVKYNTVTLRSMGVLASPPDKVDILVRAIDTVTNQPVTTLNQNHFILEQDFLPLSVESKVLVKKVTELKHLVQTVIMIDISSSITNVNLQVMKQAAKNALIDPVTGLLRVKDQEVAIYAFDDVIALKQDFSSDPLVISAAIDAIVSTAVNSTNLYGAIIKGMARLKTEATLNSLTDGNLIVITDGRDTSSYHSIYQAQASIGSNTLHLIGVQSPDLDVNAINLLTKHYIPVTSFAAVEQALTDVGKYTEALANSFYQVYYNSPARAGVHYISIHVAKSNFYYNKISGSFDAADFTPVPGAQPIAAPLVAQSGTQGSSCLLPFSLPLGSWLFLFLAGIYIVRQQRC